MLNFLNWQQRPLLLKAHRFAQSAEGALHRIGFVRLAVGLVAVGVIGRLVRYFLRFPIWGDEAFVCLNFLHRDFAGLTHSLEYAQIVPILFLWAELAVTRLLGVSELALRLLPFLAGLAALGLFWRLAWSTLPPLAAVFAVGLLAVARWPITMGAFVKPYSFDLLLALVLLVPAAEWLRRPHQLRWLVVLGLAAPVALLGSYPAIFIAGGVSLALLPTAWRSNRAGRGLFVAYNVFVAAALILNWYTAVDQQQEAPRLQAYWDHAFPPWPLWPLVKWLVLFHTGQLMAYPIGGSDGASVVTTFLFAFGVWN
jgi:Dolichyl-phosphate-mannose-protein mannosyltransferase